MSLSVKFISGLMECFLLSLLWFSGFHHAHTVQQTCKCVDKQQQQKKAKSQKPKKKKGTSSVGRPCCNSVCRETELVNYPAVRRRRAGLLMLADCIRLVIACRPCHLISDTRHRSAPTTDCQRSEARKTLRAESERANERARAQTHTHTQRRVAQRRAGENRNQLP